MNTRPKRTTSDGNSFNMWVSTNKVLIGSIGGPKKPHCRNPNFDFEETKLLISLWGDPQVQRTLVTNHKKHPVIAKLAEKMREYGYNRSSEEINTRIKNLKCFYNRIKKDLESGIVTSWKHFQAMDDIMTRPIFGNNQQQANGESEAGPSDEQLSIGDQVQVKLETVDDDKDIRTDELLKNAEQVELKEPNLLIPKDEPMDIDDDPNDPDFENDGDDEDDTNFEDSDESDFDIDSERRKARLRRRASRKSSKANTSKPTATATPTTTTTITSSIATSTTIHPTPVPVVQPTQTPNTIKIINYTGNLGGNPGLNISTILPKPNVIAQPAGQSVIVSATPTNTTTSTAGKISLVPTNFLLKPQAPNINFNSPIQLYTKPTVSMANSAPTPVVVSSAPPTVQPMQFLLVNSGGNQKQQILTSSKQIYTTTPTPIVKPSPQLQQPTQITIQPKPVMTAPPSLVAVPQKKPIVHVQPPQPPQPPVITAAVTPAVEANSKQPGIKSLMGQLVRVQRESLLLARTRMHVERQRFNNEKQIVCSLVEALNDLNNVLQGLSGTVSVGDDFEYGTTPHSSSMTNGVEKDSPVNDISQQEAPPVGSLIPVVDTIKAEVISDSD